MLQKLGAKSLGYGLAREFGYCPDRSAGLVPRLSRHSAGMSEGWDAASPMQTLILALFFSLASQSGSVAGTVVDSSGAPVSNAMVRLEAAGITIAEASTGS